jgi:hypothetical protein
MSITYNDGRISEETIVQALLKGGVTIEGKQTPATPSPFTYK